MSKRRFTGCGTALVTPFNDDSERSVDEIALRVLVNLQIEAGVDFLVPCGTTGESPTLSPEEHVHVIEIVIDEARRRVPIVAGTGSNNTAEAIGLTKHARNAGADGCLVVTPYYNRPTQAGLLDYFTSVADVGLPVIVYNIPGRTGVDILPETLARLAEHLCIVGIKEATGSVERVTQDILLCGKNLTYLSGDDPLTLPMMSVGAHGVISVLSNLLPNAVVKIVDGKQVFNQSTRLETHLRHFPIMKAMFAETNPIPIKAAMALLGLLLPVWRSPLCPPSQKTLRIIMDEMDKLDLYYSGICPVSE